MFVDLWMQNPLTIFEKTTCKMNCFNLRPLEALRRLRIASNASMSPRRLKDDVLVPQGAPKTPPKRPLMPSGWSKLCPAAQKAAQKFFRPRLWALQTSMLNPSGLDFGPSRPNPNFNPVA